MTGLVTPRNTSISEGSSQPNLDEKANGEELLYLRRA